VLKYVAAKTDLPLAQIYSVVTFYALFNLEPQGKHTIAICRGTACHTRGSRNLLDRIKMVLSLSGGEGADKLCLNTPDGEFTIRTVACFGQCALAPVVEVDHAIFGHMNERTLEREVDAVKTARQN
jgi:NADH-quinone oxidoreductase subunit E